MNVFECEYENRPAYAGLRTNKIIGKESGQRMEIQAIIDEIKERPDADRIGMILSHTGIVRGTARDGRPVSGLTVAVDHHKLQQIIEKEKQSPGIADIRVEIVENVPLSIGDEIMRLVVAGDIRDNVIPVLARTLTAVKETVTEKTEEFVEQESDNGRIYPSG